MRAPFRHMTVPVDGSATSARAVAFAIQLARGGGRLSFYSVVDPTLVCMPVAGGAAIDPVPMLTALEDDADFFCREAQDEARQGGIASDASVLHGTRVASIASFAAANGSDAIVIGTHGRTGLARGVLGSVTEGLLANADVPVIAVHEDDVVRAGPIAVALDHSPAAHAALEIATMAAAARETTIVLLHAIARAENRGLADALLGGAEKRVRARGVDVRSIVREAAAPAMIPALADELQCSMIVVGTHGRPYLKTVFVGSVARAVIEHARLPVVVVRRTING
jgi:nucleotide-binding universal stress UspA family protein